MIHYTLPLFLLQRNCAIIPLGCLAHGRGDFCIWRSPPCSVPIAARTTCPAPCFASIAAPGCNPPPTPQPAPCPPPDEARAPVLGLGQFTLMELVARIPVVNLIFFCIWSFQTDVNPNKKNWARSRLIWMGISLGLSILAGMVGIGIFSALIAGFRGAA